MRSTFDSSKNLVKKNRKKLYTPKVIPLVYGDDNKASSLIIENLDYLSLTLLNDEFNFSNKLKKANSRSISNFKGKTLSTLLFLSKKIPMSLFDSTFPRFVLRHHLYFWHNNRTFVDQELNKLLHKGSIIIFNLTTGVEDYAVSIKTEFIKYIKKEIMPRAHSSNIALIQKYIESILSLNSPNISSEFLCSSGFTESDITELVHLGLLVFHNINTYWLGIPGVGPFIKDLQEGRRQILNFLKRSAGKELLANDILKKKLRKTRLPLSFLLEELCV
ncbi:inactive serine/threonine-protein kinase 19-like isoform X2 [Zophobas morio]|uniref:inactive serine/threonine-protein kinase 19-like isoform X2 n=1 Tax=Zophobas morio TaxID=2755281 RepID=UPI003082814A